MTLRLCCIIFNVSISSTFLMLLSGTCRVPSHETRDSRQELQALTGRCMSSIHTDTSSCRPDLRSMTSTTPFPPRPIWRAYLPHAGAISARYPFLTRSKKLSCVSPASFPPRPMILSFSRLPPFHDSSLTPALADRDVVAASAFFAAMRMALKSLMTGCQRERRGRVDV